KLRIKGKQASATPQLKSELVACKQQILDIYQQLNIQSNLQLAPSSFSQQRIWFVDAMVGGGSHYNLIDCIPIEEQLDIDAFNRALNDVVERHHSLRTNYIELDGVLYQVIGQQQPLEVPVIDFTSLPLQQAYDKVQARINTSAAHVFNLAKGPMITAEICRVAEQQWFLIVNIHHIATDGWSQEILRREFVHLYLHHSRGTVGLLPPLTLQFADYAQWERDFFQGDVLTSHLQYWQQKLQGIPDVHGLPLDKPRPSIQTFNGDEYNTVIPTALLNRFQDLCIVSNLSLFMGLSAVFACLLSRISDEDDIVFATPIANREQAEMADVIGFFVNTLVLRFDFS
ncbi:MAG: condensation domain-containing protein, partial [Psychrosphaera sp.]|nr:condensation domain-containing protein [Psychrosphaera sp.]